MRFAFDADQLAFRDAVRDLLDKECTAEQVRATIASPAGRSPERWRHLAEMGVVGMCAPEEYGGLGLDETDLVLVLEEAGRAALPEPLADVAGVAVPLLRDCETLRDQWLPRVAAGEAIVAVESRGLVAHAAAADLLLLERDGEIHAVQPARARLTSQPSVDPARRLYSVDWPASEAVARAGAIRDAADRGALGAAATLAGVAARVLETAATYAAERRQFGKPIGSFQAVKHRLADALLRLSFARPVLYRAAHSTAVSAPDRSRDVSMAKALASEAATEACKAALQVHGAIGYTEESDLHLWLKRGFALSSAWGDASWHRGRVGESVLNKIGRRLDTDPNDR